LLDNSNAIGMKDVLRVGPWRRNVLLMRLSGLVSHRRRRTFVGNASGVSRGDRNARLARLRSLVPVTNAIGGIDFSDAKQMVVVTDHDWKVLARKDFPLPRLGSGYRVRLGCRACRGERLLWVTVACEAAGASATRH
jgi:hypothetical protein